MNPFMYMKAKADALATAFELEVMAKAKDEDLEADAGALMTCFVNKSGDLTEDAIKLMLELKMVDFKENDPKSLEKICKIVHKFVDQYETGAIKMKDADMLETWFAVACVYNVITEMLMMMAADDEDEDDDLKDALAIIAQFFKENE